MCAVIIIISKMNKWPHGFEKIALTTGLIAFSSPHAITDLLPCNFFPNCTQIHVVTYTKSYFSLFIGLQEVMGQILRMITCERSKNALRSFSTGSDVSVKNSFGPYSLNKMQVFGKILGIHRCKT